MKTKKKMRMQKLQKKLQKLIKNLQKTSKELKKFNEKMKKIWLSAIALFIMITLASCNVTRATTTRSEYYQRGDTTVTIQTKVIESYNAEKKL